MDMKCIEYIHIQDTMFVYVVVCSELYSVIILTKNRLYIIIS